jgi:hypothetical protein
MPKKVSQPASAKSAASVVEHLSPPVPAPTSTAAVVASSLGSVAQLRSLPVPSLASMPVPAKYHVPFVPDERQRLRKLAADLRSEALAALTELAASSATSQADLGDRVPDVAETEPLATRMAQIGDSLV